MAPFDFSRAGFCMICQRALLFSHARGRCCKLASDFGPPSRHFGPGTLFNVFKLFQKNGGSLGTQGSASHNFKQNGVIKIDYNLVTEEKILDLALNAGAEDCISYNDSIHEIRCEKEEIYKVKKLLENEIDSFISAGIEWIPTIFIEANDNEKNDILSFLEILEDNDDVQNVYSNVRFKD